MSYRKKISDNIVAIVVIPTIIGVHWGCYKIQNNDLLVSESDRKDMPMVRVYKYVKEELNKLLKT